MVVKNILKYISWLNLGFQLNYFGCRKIYTILYITPSLRRYSAQLYYQMRISRKLQPFSLHSALSRIIHLVHHVDTQCNQYHHHNH